MPQASSSGQDQDDTDAEFVEVDPSGRYGRYKEILGKGAFKKVYRGFDELEGIEVAWNQVKVADLLRNSEDMDRLYSEVHLLKTLKHKNIIKFYNSWVDAKLGHINFITEIFTSGTLRQYRKKHKHVDLRALKKWSRQILEGLLYLHSHDPPVIHRDLKCDNIFINGNQGEVKIGDLGLAAILQQAQSAHSVIGTPEFMAPELYEEEYNELVDIYAFGMCLLELVTFEYPYVECTNAAQIFKKVSSGIKPASLAKVADPVVRAFIEKCIAKASDRLPAKELLEDPFLQPNVENDESVSHSLLPNPQYSGNTHADDGAQLDNHDDKDTPPESGRDFMVEGQRKDVHTILVKLRIADSAGLIRNIRFPFYIGSDTSVAVASEMVHELDLTDQDVSAIAAMIDSVIHSIIPDWEPKDITEVNINEEVVVPDNSATENKDDALTLSNSCNLVLDRTPSGRKYWSDLTKGLSGDSSGKSAFSNYVFNPESVVDGGKSPRSFRNEGNSLNDSVHSHDGDVGEKNASAFSSDSQLGEGNSKSLGFVINGEHYLGLNYTLMEDESENGKIVMLKLKQLLVEQKKELDELKTLHELAVSALLLEFPPEIREKISLNYGGD